MRTTVEIPDPLLRRAKLAAVEQGTTLKQLVTRGLEQVLQAGASTAHRMVKPPLTLAPDSPLRTMSPEDLARIDAEDEAGEADEVYRRH